MSINYNCTVTSTPGQQIFPGKVVNLRRLGWGHPALVSFDEEREKLLVRRRA